MDDRLLALVVVTLLCLGVWAGSAFYRAWLARRTHMRESLLAQFGLPPDGRPIILAFTGEYCLPCKTQQHPALERLRNQLGESVHIQEVDALALPGLAQFYGVLTVPTTVVLDGTRSIIAINYGVASTEKLRKQVVPYLADQRLAHAATSQHYG